MSFIDLAKHKIQFIYEWEVLEMKKKKKKEKNSEPLSGWN